MLITLIVLVMLNIYCSAVSQKIFYNSKRNSLLELCNIASNNIENLEVMNESTVITSVEQLVDTQTTRLVVVLDNCRALVDTNTSESLVGKLVVYPEIVKALEGNDVFRWVYTGGVIRAYTAMPIYSYGELIGCVYMSQYDYAQGRLIFSLQLTILTITIFLEIAVILCSLLFSNIYTKRLRKIMRLIRNVRGGDYTHQLELTGSDELKLLTDEFNDLVGRLQISESKRNRFVSDASHELKTPLASIKLLSDSILQNNMDLDTIREFVADIGNEAERLNRLSQKLLTLSRIDSHDELPNDTSLVTPVINNVLRMLRTNIEQKQICVNMSICDDPGIQIHHDDLYQILFNLVENAIKYNQESGLLGIIVKEDADMLSISISDSGIGIPEDSISHIFERFYRVDKARDRATGGSGLGLSIVRNLIKRNNGMINVESQIGVGTTFTVRFPIQIKQQEVHL